MMVNKQWQFHFWVNYIFNSNCGYSSCGPSELWLLSHDTHPTASVSAAVWHGRCALAPSALVVRAVGARTRLLPLGVRPRAAVAAIWMTVRARPGKDQKQNEIYQLNRNELAFQERNGFMTFSWYMNWPGLGAGSWFRPFGCSGRAGRARPALSLGLGGTAPLWFGWRAGFLTSQQCVTTFTRRTFIKQANLHTHTTYINCRNSNIHFITAVEESVRIT